MYFKEKNDTNIDAEFKEEKKLNFDFNKLKPVLLIGGGILLLIIIVMVGMSLFNNKKDKYVIELFCEDNITIGLNTKDECGYRAYDKQNNDVTNQVRVVSNVDTSKVGKYEVLYSIGKINKVRYVSVVEIIDETVIYLKGNKNIYLEVGDKYQEPGYTVVDGIDQNLTDKVKVSGNVDTKKEGVYQITYSVVNSRNVTTTVKRTVIVSKKNGK